MRCVPSIQIVCVMICFYLQTPIYVLVGSVGLSEGVGQPS